MTKTIKGIPTTTMNYKSLVYTANEGTNALGLGHTFFASYLSLEKPYLDLYTDFSACRIPYTSIQNNFVSSEAPYESIKEDYTTLYLDYSFLQTPYTSLETGYTSI